MLYLYLNLVILTRHLIVNVFWASFIILLELQPKSKCLCPKREEISIEVTKISMIMLSLRMWPLRLFMSREYLMMRSTHRGLQAPCWNDVIDHHAPCKSKLMKCDSVPYMNSELREALYKRNIVRNKFRKFGKAYWEENRIHRNYVVSIRKRSIANCFSKQLFPKG